MQKIRSCLSFSIIAVFIYLLGNIGVVSAHSGDTVDAVYGTTPTIDGTISAGEWADASTLTLTGLPDGDVTVYVKQDGTSLYIAFDIPDRSLQSPYDSDYAQICFDLNNDGGTSPQTDDHRYYINPGGHGPYPQSGTGTDWGFYTGPGLCSCASSTSSDGWQAEFKFPFREIGNPSGDAKIGAFIYVQDQPWRGSAGWPPHAWWMCPDGWGDMFSSNDWRALPTLSFESVAPTAGGWGTTFTFEVTYKDTDGDFPVEGYPKLYIDREPTGRTMVERDLADKNVTDGKVYKYDWVTIPADIGTHEFHFYTLNQYGESAFSPSMGTHSGPTITKQSPSLTCSVDDNLIRAEQTVVFSGYLRDAMGGGMGGRTVKLYKNGLEILTAITEDDGFYTIPYVIPSTPRTSRYYTRAAGDLYYESSKSSTVSVSINQTPLLSTGSVNLASGVEGTNFVFEITYTDADGDAPSHIAVYIDNVGYPMTLVSGDYTTGALYRYTWSSTSADIGKHNYHFEVSDGFETAKSPAIGAYSGPTVVGKAPPIFPIIIAIVIGLCVVTATVLFIKKKS